VHGQRFIHLIHRYYPFRGGSEYYFQSLSERLVRDGADVRVVTTDAWDLEYFWNPAKQRISVPFERHNGVRIYRTPAHHLPVANLSHRVIRRGMGELSRIPVPAKRLVLRQMSRFGPWLPELPALLDRIGHQADLIHPANIALETIIREAADFARKRDIPLAITPKLHLGESDASTVRRYYTMPHQIDLMKHADLVMTQTSVEADFLEQNGVTADRIKVVGLGINVDEVTGGDGTRAREILGIDGPLVLSLGAAAFDKGTVHACQAVLALNESRSAPVTIVVAGPVMSDFQRYYDSLTQREKRTVRLLGYVDDQFRTDLLAGCDVLTLASRTEAFGYVFLEAWANRKPVIGARAGGIPAVIDDGHDGILVSFGAVKELAAAIAHVVDNPGVARKLGAAGEENKVVDTENWYQKVVACYRDLIGTPTVSEGT
jgi:glycogen synthase